MIFGFFEFFLRIFNFLFLCIKQSNYLLFKRGLRLFKGLCLLFLPNVPGATFIQEGTSISESKVHYIVLKPCGMLTVLPPLLFCPLPKKIICPHRSCISIIHVEHKVGLSCLVTSSCYCQVT